MSNLIKKIKDQKIMILAGPSPTRKNDKSVFFRDIELRRHMLRFLLIKDCMVMMLKTKLQSIQQIQFLM